MKTYGVILNGISVAYSVMLVQLIDKYLYDMSIWIGAMMVGCLCYVFFRVAAKFKISNKKVSKRMSYTLNFFIVSSIFLAYYLLGI